MVGAEPALTLQWTGSVGKEVKREKYVQLEAAGDVQTQQCGEMISTRVGHIPLQVTEERLELLVRSKIKFPCQGLKQRATIRMVDGANDDVLTANCHEGRGCQDEAYSCLS